MSWPHAWLCYGLDEGVKNTHPDQALPWLVHYWAVLQAHCRWNKCWEWRLMHRLTLPTRQCAIASLLTQFVVQSGWWKQLVWEKATCKAPNCIAFHNLPIVVFSLYSTVWVLLVLDLSSISRTTYTGLFKNTQLSLKLAVCFVQTFRQKKMNDLHWTADLANNLTFGDLGFPLYVVPLTWDVIFRLVRGKVAWRW